MKALFKTILVGAVLAMAGVAVGAAAGDPVVGTWTLNVAKSKFDAGQAAFKSQTRIYTADSDGISVTVKGEAADGTAVSQQSTFKYDNKAYAWTGAADYDAVSLKRVNGSTVNAILMKGGKTVGTTKRTISGHGKVLTLSSQITGADGKAYSVVLVFDKQS
jgi:hypothetical protein